MSVLNRILEDKRREIEARAAKEPFFALKRRAEAGPEPRGFARALLRHRAPVIIAEVKRASPSKGLIRPDLDAVKAAGAFAVGGAACLSVLTDEPYFSGRAEFIEQIRNALPAGPPLLRKDFIIDPYQVWESRALGADALLLIAAAMEESALQSLLVVSREAGLDALIEVHNEQEIESALRAASAVYSAEDGESTPIFGINNRDLNSFETSLDVTLRLAPELRSKLDRLLPGTPIVAESGIFTEQHLYELLQSGAAAFLIGESLVASGDPGENLAALIARFHKLHESK